MTLHRTMQTLEKDCDSYDTTIYADGAATHGTIGIIVTTAPPQITLESVVSELYRPANCARSAKSKRKQCKHPSNWHRRMSIYIYIYINTPTHTKCASTQQVDNSNEILDALASRTEGGCHLTFTWCPSHSGIYSNQLADVAAMEGTTVEQEGVGHHYDSVKAAILQATKEPPITHERQCRIGGESWKCCRCQASQNRNSARYCLPKYGMWMETVEHAMGDCPPIHHPANQPPESYPSRCWSCGRCGW